MPALARKLRFADYFALAFGTIDRKSTRLNSSHTVIYSLSLHDALPIAPRCESSFRTTLRPLNACPRAQTPPCRLLRARLWNDGRCRLAGVDARLAGPQRAARRHVGFRIRRNPLAASRLRLRPVGAAAPGRGGRSCLHGPGFPANRQLFYGLDDAAGVLHRLPVGSGGGGQTCRLYFPFAGFIRIVPSRWSARLPAASAARYCTHAVSRAPELPRDTIERQFSELDDDVGTSSLRRPVRYQRCLRGSCQFSSSVSRRSIDFHRADTSNRPLFHDRIRIGAQGGGGSPF